MSGTAANSLGFVYLTILSLATTPTLITAWGVSTFGEWLMLTTIPAYLALSDLGFATAARNTMAMTIARGERARSLRIFHSLVALHLVALVVIMALTGLVLGVLAATSLFEFVAKYWLLITLISLYSWLLLFSRVIMSGLLAAGEYTKPTLLYDTGNFIASLAILPVALLGGDFVDCVLIWIACWIAINAGLWTSLASTVGWLTIGTKWASATQLRELFTPALASLAIPGAGALSQQGVALVVGFAISPAATATLIAVRTATRVAVQAVSVVNRATVLEFSVAKALQNKDAVARILWVNVLAVAILLTPVVVVFVAFGPQMISLWTNGAIVPGRDFIALMALGMVLHTCWYFGTTLLMATNSHISMVSVLVGASTGLAVLSWPAAQYLDLPGVALVAAIAEAACLVRFLFVGRSAGMALPRAALVDLVRGLGRKGRDA